MKGQGAGSCQWRIGVRARGVDRAWEGSWDRWRWIKAPVGHYYADPIIWEHLGMLDKESYRKSWEWNMG